MGEHLHFAGIIFFQAVWQLSLASLC